jgi:hypothetical protein
MIRAACHCEAVKFEIAEPPNWVLDCNCTLCRRYGALWTYFRGPEGQAKLLKTPDPAATEAYTWQDGDLAFHRCKTCGCVTHIVAAKADPPVIYAVNCRMIAALDPATVTVRQIDNSHSGYFWTAADEPPLASRHPPMPKPGPEDWR